MRIGWSRSCSETWSRRTVGGRPAIAMTPRIPRRRLERVDGSPVLEIEVDLAEMSSTLPLPSPLGEADEALRPPSLPHHSTGPPGWRPPTHLRHQRGGGGGGGQSEEPQVRGIRERRCHGSSWRVSMGKGVDEVRRIVA